MKIILNIFFVSFIALSSLTSDTNVSHFENEKLYVLAPNGLTLRKGSLVSSEKITVVPYGATVEILTIPKSLTMKVDNIKGGMFQVKYNNVTGYMFSGYLSKFPAPIKYSGAEKYVTILRESGFDIYYEGITRDYGGYSQFETAFSLPTTRWEEAFLIAKQLHDIPEKINFPDESNKKIENPDKNDTAWSDEVSRTNDEKTGELKSIDYSNREEGGGYYINITKDPESIGFIIRYKAVAD